MRIGKLIDPRCKSLGSPLTARSRQKISQFDTQQFQTLDRHHPSSARGGRLLVQQVGSDFLIPDWMQ
jgi:hypothetical protein